MQLPEKVMYFLEKQGFVVVSTIDGKGGIHCAAKGILSLEKEGKVFIVDVFQNRTSENLRKDPRVSITSIDEQNFIGYTLQGKAKIVPREEMHGHIIEKWENQILKRISKRVAGGVQSGAKSKGHFEVKLPPHPKYLIEIDVDNIIDLSPPKNDEGS